MYCFAFRGFNSTVLQKDSCTVVDLHEAVGKVRKSIGALKSAPLLGGWQEALRDSITESEEGTIYEG